MTTRRAFLGTAGLLGASAVLADGRWGLARADKPVNLSGWVFKPDTVKDYIDFYNNKHHGQVKYEPSRGRSTTRPWRRGRSRARSWTSCIAITTTRAVVRERPLPASGRPPGVDELKKKMTPANLDSLKSKDGTKLLGLPYFTSLFILIYNEPMLQQAGIKAPAKSWDELVEHCMKLKKDKVSETPFLPNWNNSPSGDHAPVHERLFLRGRERLRREEPASSSIRSRGRRRHGAVAEGVQGRPRESRGPHQDVVHRHAPAVLVGPLRVPHESLVLPQDHRGGAGELQAGAQEGQDGHVPGHRSVVHVDGLLRVNAKSKNLEDAWKLTRFLAGTSTETGTCSGSGA
jgi:hypothetical protein